MTRTTTDVEAYLTEVVRLCRDLEGEAATGVTLFRNGRSLGKEDWQRCEYTIVSLAAELRQARVASTNPQLVMLSDGPEGTGGYDEIDWDDMSPREVVDAVIDLESQVHGGVLGESATVLFQEGWQDLGGSERSRIRELLTLKVSEILADNVPSTMMNSVATAKRLNELIQISKPGASVSGGKG